MKKKNLLFVCRANLHRSPTAQGLFKNSKQYQAKSCGTHLLSETVISKQAIKWADIIFCMEDEQKDFILENFPEAKDKNIKILNIPDVYIRDNPKLIRILKEKLRRWL